MDDAIHLSGRNGEPSTLAAAFLLSAGLHVLLGGFLVFFVPRWEARKPDFKEVITVQLMGSLSPPAPAAPPAPVVPDLKGPDVVEAPRSDPALNQPPPPEPAALTAPAEVIPLGPKAPEKPVLKKTPAAPPKVTPPKVAADPPPKPKAPPNRDAEINRRLDALKRKAEADRREAAIESRLVDLRKRQGLGQGESSEDSGGASGSQRLHPEKEAYYRQVKDIVSFNWRPPVAGLAASLKAVFTIKIETSGQVSALRLDQSSGNPDYDLSVERAIRQSVLPPLPSVFEGRADTPGLIFSLDEMRR
ncbi:MAG: TonB C-terminal domain-containing protein [Candidatus Adiutrix sp.]|jgi:colicin import membrane protein|nr:TonB C-terminal domain-containing protein [Candidatus Adiutrix sp.]